MVSQSRYVTHVLQPPATWLGMLIEATQKLRAPSKSSSSPSHPTSHTCIRVFDAPKSFLPAPGALGLVCCNAATPFKYVTGFCSASAWRERVARHMRAIHEVADQESTVEVMNRIMAEVNHHREEGNAQCGC